jgi:hypothetical protein
MSLRHLAHARHAHTSLCRPLCITHMLNVLAGQHARTCRTQHAHAMQVDGPTDLTDSPSGLVQGTNLLITFER